MHENPRTQAIRLLARAIRAAGINYYNNLGTPTQGSEQRCKFATSFLTKIIAYSVFSVT
jgi:hypothetical protein